MATVSTRMGAAQDALANLIRNDASFAEVAVDEPGWPAGEIKPEQVWVAGGVEDWTQEWASSGSNAPRLERFTLQLHLYVHKAATWVDTRNRALELVALVEKLVRANPTLAGATFHAETVGGELEEDVQAEHRAAHARVGVRCSAYVYPTT